MELAQLIYGRLDRSWQAQANCMGVDPDLFFPERGASTREAKEVCRGCVVREDCLEYALANGEKFGIWGGLSERERRKIRRRRALEHRGVGVPTQVGPLAPRPGGLKSHPRRGPPAAGGRRSCPQDSSRARPTGA